MMKDGRNPLGTLGAHPWPQSVRGERRAEARMHVPESADERPGSVPPEPFAEPASPVTIAGPDRQALARALQDLEATRARVERDAEQLQQQKKRELVVELLPVLDNLERAIFTAETDETQQPCDDSKVCGWCSRQLEGVLDSLWRRARGCGRAHVRPGEPRSDQRHTGHGSLAQIGLVLHQLAPGYRLGGKLLRPAKVTVGVRAALPASRHHAG